MSLTSATRTEMLDAAAAAITHLSLHTADPGDTGVSEVSGGSYARLAAGWSTATGTHVDAANKTFTIPAGTPGWVGFWSASTGGTFHGAARLAVASLQTAGAYTVPVVRVSLDAGDITFYAGQTTDGMRLLLHDDGLLQAPTRIDPDGRIWWVPGHSLCPFDSEQGGWPVVSVDEDYDPLAVVLGSVAVAGPWFTADEVWLNGVSNAAYVSGSGWTLSSSQVWTVEGKWAMDDTGSQRRMFRDSQGAFCSLTAAGAIQYNDNDGHSTASASTVAALLGIAATDPFWFRAIATSTTIVVDVSADGGSWTNAIPSVTISARALSTIHVGCNVTTSAATGRCSFMRVRDGGAGDPIVAHLTSALFASGNRVNGATAVDGHGTTWTVTRPDWAASTDAPRRLPARSSAYFSFPGVSGEYVSTPDTTANSITGDLDIVARVSFDDLTPAANESLIGEWATAPNLAYLLAIHTSGALRLYTSTTGSDSITGTSTATLGSVTSADTAVWVRATYDPSTGDKEFFYSLDNVNTSTSVSWTQLGATVSGTSGAIPDTTSALMAGAHGGGSSWNFSGEVYVAEIYDDGNLVERIAADDADPNASTWVSPTSGQTITANRAAAAQYHVAAIPSGVEAAQTDGVDDKLTVIGDDSVGDFDPTIGLSLAAWIRVHDGAGSYGRVLTNGDTGDNGVTIQRHATNPRFRGYLKDGTNAASPGDNVDNVTYGGQALIVAAFGSSDHEFYADGVSIETTSTAVVVETSTNPMTMGMRPDGASPLAVTIFGAAVVGRRIDDAAAVTIAAEGLGS